MVFPGDALDFTGLELADRPTANIRVVNVDSLNNLAGALSLERRVNTGLVGLVLSVTHGLKQDSTEIYRSGLRSAPGQGGASRQRLDPRGRKNYDRIVILADVGSNHGRCFAVILENNTKSHHFFRTGLRRQLGVGNVYLIKEPGAVENSLGSTESVSVISDYNAVLSVINPVSIAVAEVPFVYPPGGHTRYFCYHGRTVTLGMATVCNDTCPGSFCDRQNERNPRRPCGCFHFGQGTPCVIQCQFEMTIPAHDASPEELLVVPAFRSKRTGELFAADQAMRFAFQNSQPEEPLLRNAVDQCVAHVNANGGWSVIGWIRTGIQADVSDANNISGLAHENMSSITTKPHVSYLYPTNAAVIGTAEYRNMRYAGDEAENGDNADV